MKLFRRIRWAGFWIGCLLVTGFVGNRVFVGAQTEDIVGKLVINMSLEEKIGQMILVEKNSIQKEDLVRKDIGALLSGGGGNPTDNTPKGWRDMIAEFQQYALQTDKKIPLLYGVDAVHGTANVRGAVVFPHNIGFGATRESGLVERSAAITAQEMRAVGQNWNFAPMLSIPTDLRWGRVFESFSEDPLVVSAMGASYVRGLVQGGVLATPKHFIGEGLESWGSSRQYSLDQGNIPLYEQQVLDRDLPAFRAAIDSGAMSIMVSRSSIQNTKMIASHHLLTTILKEELGFDGFLVSDWAGVDLLPDDLYKNVVTAINVGVDMIMVPGDYDKLMNNLTYAISNGDIPRERIDDAVTRILRAKESIGLLHQGRAAPTIPLEEVGSDEHRAVAREVVRKSLVLLKNDSVLPIPLPSTLLVVGQGADDIGLQCGGWTIEWQGKRGGVTEGTTILEGLGRQYSNDSIQYYPQATSRKGPRADVGIVVIAEEPYAEGVGDREKLAPSDEDVKNIEFAKRHSKKVVLVMLVGRPILITEILPQVDAVVVAWLPGSEGDGVSDVLSGQHNFSGTLPFFWPRTVEQLSIRDLKPTNPLFPLGFGLQYK